MGYSIIRTNDCGVEDNIISTKDYADVVLKYAEMSEEKYKQECENAKKAAQLYDYHLLTEKVEHILEKCL